MVTSYYKLQKVNLESLNPYIYIAVKKNLNSFSGKCNESQENNQHLNALSANWCALWWTVSTKFNWSTWEVSHHLKF